jgi:hypothetical protein
MNHNLQEHIDRVWDLNDQQQHYFSQYEVRWPAMLPPSFVKEAVQHYGTFVKDKKKTKKPLASCLQYTH